MLTSKLEEALKYRLAITMLPGIGPVTQRSILQYLGDPAALFQARAVELSKIPGMGPQAIKSSQQFNAWNKIEKEIQFIKRKGTQALFISDEQYPERLKHIPDAPVLLFQQGDYDLNARRTIAIVGTRRASSYGREITQELVKQLRESQVTIISGLAYGIDTFAHKYAVQEGIGNIAVLGHGLDRIYPAENTRLAQSITNNGALLTEYPSGTQPDRSNFPERNRIVAGMCDALVVVETGVKGGAMITADLAFQFDREVFAVPGKIKDPYSEGCNTLIRKTKAYCYADPQSLLQHLGWDEPVNPKQDFIPDIFEHSLLGILKQKKDVHIDELSQLSGMPGPELSLLLLDLELKGCLRALPGKFYRTA